MRELVQAVVVSALVLLLGLAYLLSYGVVLRQYSSPTIAGVPRWLARAYWPAGALIRHDLMPQGSNGLVDRYRAYLFECVSQSLYRPRPPVFIVAAPSQSLRWTGSNRFSTDPIATSLPAAPGQ